jgi:hypothetical protein
MAVSHNNLWPTVMTVSTALAALGSIGTGVIIFWQARLLRIQNQINALLQLNSVWDSDAMLALRSFWAREPEQPDRAEQVLEFLEEFAGLGRRRILRKKLIWDSTIGWHAARYYFYNKENGNFDRLKAKWLDETLYQNLDRLWRDYVSVENRERRKTGRKSLEEQIRQTRQKFIIDEQKRYATRISKDTH